MPALAIYNYRLASLSPLCFAPAFRLLPQTLTEKTLLPKATAARLRRSTGMPQSVTVAPQQAYLHCSRGITSTQLHNTQGSHHLLGPTSVPSLLVTHRFLNPGCTLAPPVGVPVAYRSPACNESPPSFTRRRGSVALSSSALIALLWHTTFVNGHSHKYFHLLK